MPGFITSDRYCTLSTGNLTSPSHFYKRARPRAAAPAPSPGTKHLFPAPLAGVGDAAVEAIVDDPRPEVSAKTQSKADYESQSSIKANAPFSVRCLQCNGHEETIAEPHTGHGGRRIRA